MQFELGALASKLSGVVRGDSGVTITGVSGLENAEPGDLVFAEAPRFLLAALKGRASAVIVTPQLAEAVRESPKPLLEVERPRVAFVQVLQMFAPPRNYEPGIDASARVGAGTKIGAGVHIGANAVVGNGVVLEDGVALLPGVFVGDGCSIGAGTTIHPNAVIYRDVKIGRGCILHAGCVIGADGFGYVPVDMRAMKVPHLGIVEVGDDVEIGANTCIDRAKTGVTRIGSGTKIDNLVHIAHNVTVGLGCLIVAQAGVAGSVSIGNGVVLGGQAGLKDHITLGDGSRVGAQGGVIGNVDAGVTVSGYPARPHQEKMRELAALTSLPDALKRLRSMEKRLAAIEALHAPGDSSVAKEHAGDPGVPVIPEDGDRGEYEGQSGPPRDVGPVG